MNIFAQLPFCLLFTFVNLHSALLSDLCTKFKVARISFPYFILSRNILIANRLRPLNIQNGTRKFQGTSKFNVSGLAISRPQVRNTRQMSTHIPTAGKEEIELTIKNYSQSDEKDFSELYQSTFNDHDFFVTKIPFTTTLLLKKNGNLIGFISFSPESQ